MPFSNDEESPTYDQFCVNYGNVWIYDPDHFKLFP